MSEHHAPLDAAAPRLSDEAIETSALLVDLLEAAYAARRATPPLAAPEPANGEHPAADDPVPEIGPHAARVAMYVYRHGSRTIGQLADGLAISYGWASRVVESLESAGLMRRERDETDRRIVHVSLEPDAAPIIERAYRWHGDAVAEALEPLEEAERAAVRRFLRGLADGLRRASRDR